MNNTFLRNFLGSKELASEVAQRVQKTVPAYQKFLQKQGMNIGDEFENLPQSDKQTYALAFPWEELLADNYDECFSINRSSGALPAHQENHSTGHKLSQTIARLS